MLSRVAETIYWMCRYIERAENVARFVDVNLHLNLDMPDTAGNQQWEPLVTITGDHDVFRERYDAPTSENVIQFLTFDAAYSNSILACLRMARENARMVREIISTEMWEQVNRFYLMVTQAARTENPGTLSHEFFEQVKMASHLFTGITQDTMTHGEAWHFAQMGRLLERADKTSRILDVKYFILLPRVEYVGTSYDNIQWAAVLKSVSGLETYRKRYRRLHPSKVAEFLLFDSSFPRAVRYCLTRAQERLCAISNSPEGSYQNEAERTLGRLRYQLGYADIKEVLDTGMHQYIDELQIKLNQVGDAISGTFFGSCYLPESTPTSSQTQIQ